MSCKEPWSGKYWKHPLSFLGSRADRELLAPMYERLASAIRQHDTKKLLFFEPISINFNNVGFTSPPGGEGSKSVLAYHYYLSFTGKQKYLSMREADAKRLGVVSFATEFDISWNGALQPDLSK